MEEREDREENVGTINTISGGLAAGGSSGQAQKAYAREVCVMSQPTNKKQKIVPVATITFFDEDSKGIKTPNDDLLVITIKARNFDVKRVLVDNGSSAEVLFYDAFKKMNTLTNHTPLYGFSKKLVAVEGIIALPVAIDTPPTQANFMLDFVVIKIPSAFNGIVGRLALNQLHATVSTYHLKMKFPTEHGIGDCYMASCRSKKALIIEDLREEYLGEENKIVRIGSNLKEDTKLELVNLLRTYADVFPWTAEDMPVIDPEVITHRLNVDPSRKPVKQKKRTFALERLEKIEEKTRYPKIDKIALALIISARHLRPYFQSHTIIVLTDQPLRKVLLSRVASGRLVNWSVELGEFDIQYKPRTTIKAQALADFIVECTSPEDPSHLVISEVPNPWNLYVDGSSAIGGSGSGIILISLEGFMVEYALRFGFQASKNEVEYEALLAGIRLAHALKVDSLSVHSDSLLVVNHIFGDNEAKDERMAQYIHLVKTLATKFKNFTIQQISREHNTQANTLSRLASAEVTDVRSSVYLESLKERSISSQTNVGVVDQEPCWMDMIIKYLSTGELPSERHEERNLRVKAASYDCKKYLVWFDMFSTNEGNLLMTVEVTPSSELYTLKKTAAVVGGR
ncbi:hypothetical protein RJ639_019977 [Escallonia herrerae]|uniref:RNase H type-1 domain-containing protein n=1 Tax=Escallonia herrerae TaxID=1293975 RepID=A0AA88V9E4_9ASTE|nr:hypothetical protein RJ639_022995 [Escallonia herrerae]KAK3002688.1 hypothetical protein RJ639_019977 [Escallonia herrerae]